MAAQIQDLDKELKKALKTPIKGINLATKMDL